MAIKFNIVPNSNLLGLRFFVYCNDLHYNVMQHSYLNDMEITKNKTVTKGLNWVHSE